MKDHAVFAHWALVTNKLSALVTFFQHRKKIKEPQSAILPLSESNGVNPMTKPWHAMETNEVIQNLEMSPITGGGLTTEEAQRRLKDYGYVEIAETKRRTALAHVLRREANRRA